MEKCQLDLGLLLIHVGNIDHNRLLREGKQKWTIPYDVQVPLNEQCSEKKKLQCVIEE